MEQRFSIRTEKHAQFIDITSRVKTVLVNSGINNGICLVFVPHTTAGITVNEAADPDVQHDMLRELDCIVPLEHGYRHAEGNSAAHIKASLMGSSVSIPVVDGRLTLGTWQGIFFCEFDGPRSRSVQILLQSAEQA